MTRCSKAIMCGLVVLLQLSVLGCAQGLVLCVAPDGHMKIELAHDSCCPDVHSEENKRKVSVATAFRGQSHDDSHCASCVDIPIGIDKSTRQQNLFLQKSKSSVKEPVALASGFSISSLDDISQQYALKSQYAFDDTIISLRSVILRT